MWMFFHLEWIDFKIHAVVVNIDAGRLEVEAVFCLWCLIEVMDQK